MVFVIILKFFLYSAFVVYYTKFAVSSAYYTKFAVSSAFPILHLFRYWNHSVQNVFDVFLSALEIVVSPSGGKVKRKTLELLLGFEMN